MLTYHLPPCYCGTPWSRATFYATVSDCCKDCHKARMMLRRRTDPKVRESEIIRNADPVHRARDRARRKRKALRIKNATGIVRLNGAATS
jgi:hypothetical protein